MARNKLVWLVCLAILSVLPAGATLETYTTLTEWQAVATQAGATIDFTSLAPNPGNVSAMYVTLVIGGVTFTSPSDWVQVYNASSSQPYYDWGTGAILRSNKDTLGALKAALATPVTAFAALMGINKENPPGTYISSQMDVKVRSGDTVVWEQTLVTSAHPTPTLFGIVSTNPLETFDSVTFTPTENYAFVDDVMLGAYQEPPPPGDTPELGTGVLSLCGGILLAAGGFRRRGKPS
ncbi:MAG: hypothetical protein NT090_25900 [Acidobacteria bacterium]|nr:hypothetical protein [Acidobacteriota bacterium]